MSDEAEKPHCPTCGKFVSPDATGFHDFPPGGGPGDYVVIYCNEGCADRKSPPCTYEEDEAVTEAELGAGFSGVDDEGLAIYKEVKGI